MAIENPVTQGAGSAVVGAIRTAARATGTNFQYLLATAQVESGLDPNAAVASSSAKGLFQFIDQTWLTTLKEAGPALGYGRYADAIAESPSGRYEVPDPGVGRQVFPPGHRSGRQCGDGRRLHAAERRAAYRSDRPAADRGRALRGAFPRRVRRRPLDQPRRQQSQ